MFKYCGKNVNIEHNARFGGGGNLEIGDYSGLGVNMNILGNSCVKIGQYVMMAPDVTIVTTNHDFADTSKPMMFQGSTTKPVEIGDDVWIGTRAIILPGVKIGSGVLIVAGAVVAKDIPDYAIAGGVPARVIKYRNQPTRLNGSSA